MLLYFMLLIAMVISIVVFFFFKQKTAYEMRISDWSSDVCSSDLRRSVRGRGDRRTPRREAARSRHGDDAHPVHPAPAHRRAPARRNLPMIENKIGRASCRERVCQYV